MRISGRDWEADYRAGRLDFLSAADEQLRHAVIASLIESYGPGEVIDLGCGPGHQLRWLNPRFATRYLAVDVSATALAAIPRSPVPTETICAPIEEFACPPRPIGSIICAEVLYALPHAAEALTRIVAGASRVGAVIVTLLGGRSDKPNWAKGSAHVWRELERTGWPVAERVRIEVDRRKVAWDIGVFTPGREP